MLAPGLTATSVTGYYSFDEVNSHDASIGPRAILLVPYLPFEMQQYTQELRLASDWDSPLNFTVGAFYETRDTYRSQDAVITAFPPASFAIGQEEAFQNQDAFSVFAQLLWTPKDRLEISGGARYSEENKDLRFLHRGVDVTANLQKDSLKFDNLSPELTISYDVNDDIMVFGSYKEGFKSGGFDGGFYVPASKGDRLAQLYHMSNEGVLSNANDDIQYGGSYLEKPQLEYGGAGLVGTPLDYMNFAQMLLNKGNANGRQILSQKAVELMTSNQLDESYGDAPLAAAGRGPSTGFGFCGLVTVALRDGSDPGSVGEYGWSGWASTNFWMDPANDLVGLVFTQVIPDDIGSIRLTHDVREVIYGGDAAMASNQN